MKLAVAVLLLSLLMLPTRARADNEGAALQKLISAADLDYDTPARRSEEGMPIGNGRMGSLVWTTPGAAHLQINRCDVFAEDCTTTSFPRTHSDYASGCGFVDIRFDSFGEPALAGGSSGTFHQHLAIANGLMTLNGAKVTARAMAVQDHNVFAIEVDDQRDAAAPISVDLRMLRYVSRLLRGRSFPATNPHSNTVATGAHTATSAFEIRDGRLVLTQEFREVDYFDASAVAVAIVGRESQAEFANETTARLIAAPGKGKFTILISSAAGFDRGADVGAMALKEIDSGAKRSFDDLLAANETWWKDFWSRGYINATSTDGVADFVSQNYAYFLYVMASSSRGDYPARFGGMLWYSNGDLRAWGSQYWWANQSCYYNGLAPTNRFELLDPTFSMYTKMYDSCAFAAKQQWGSEGVWLPETSWFNGLAKLPQEIGEEMQQLYLLKKPWKDRSERFMQYARAMQSFNSRWNWISQSGHYEMGQWVLEDKGAPPFGHVTHIFGTTAKIANLYWQKYEYTQDEKWLRERAWPMLRGCVEFYRNFPNVWKEDDGKYHIHHTNSNEPAWGVRDSDEDLAAMHGLIPIAIRASEILNLESDLRDKWKDFLANLAPIPTTETKDALRPDDYTGPRVWVKGTKPAAKAGGMLPDGNTLPHWNFELATVNSPDSEMKQTAMNTLNAFFRRGASVGANGGVNPEMYTGTLSRIPIAAAAMGRADAVKYLIPNQMRRNERPSGDGIEVFRNRMALREGAGATECQRLGRGAEALHTALLQTAPPTPGADSIIRVFPAWPKEWDVSFKLLARGAFLVSATMKAGEVKLVEIESRAGGECRLVNPWNDSRGPVLKFPTEKGQRVVLRPQ